MATISELLDKPQAAPKPTISGLLGDEPKKEKKEEPKLEVKEKPTITNLLGEKPKKEDTAARIPTEFGQGFTYPVQEFLGLGEEKSTVAEAARRAFKEGAEAQEKIFSPQTTKLEKGLGVLQYVGAEFNLAFSPLTGFIEAFFGRPTERVLRAQGVESAKGVGREIGEYGSLATQMFYGTPLLKPVRKGVEELAKKQPVQAVKAIFAPEKLDKAGQTAAVVIRSRDGQFARAKEQSLAALEESKRALNQLPVGTIEAGGRATANSQLAFIDAMETGTTGTLAPELQTAAEQIRKQLDFWRNKAQEFGALNKVIENYFPHIWKNGGKLPKQMQDAAASEYYNATRKIKGSQAFRKQRSISSTLEGISMGLEPVSTNPVDLAIIKIHEMQKFYYGNLLLKDMKKMGLIKFAKNIGELGPGWRALNKPEFRVFAPPSLAEHFMSFDQPMREGLQTLASYLGIDIKMPLTDRILKGGARGYTQRNIPEVVARFGTDDGVLQHEIGHQLDFKFKLANYFQKNKQAWKELGELAKLREPGSTGPYLAYLLEPTERIANLFNAYWHAPELLRTVAPTAFIQLEKFLASAGNVGQLIKEIKPGVQRSQESRFESGIGPQYVGQYFAKDSAYNVLDNYLSAGLRGNSLYDALKTAGNALNQAQLALPGFHATMVSIDTITSEVARALDQAYNLEFGRSVKTLLSSPAGVVTSYIKGKKLRSAYLLPDNAPGEMKLLADAVSAGGGRIKMDEFYKASGSGNYIKSWKDGSLVRDILGDYKDKWYKPFGTMVGTVLDAIAYPVMGELVPNVKLGVHAKLAEDWIRRNPNATPIQVNTAMSKIWDSVDNRLGQMVYDNVFWNKTGKDLAFLSVRSVGWNLGTIRELGGGAVDIGKFAIDGLTGEKPELTYKMAYTMSLPIVVGTLGAMMTYVFTGRGPQTYMDYFFPPTGGTTAKGSVERVNIPSYMKDVFEYYEDPVQTLTNKAHPMFSVASQMYKNRDYYGAMIADPTDPMSKYYSDWTKFLVGQFTPFAYQGYKKLKEEETPEQKISPEASLLGFGPAPASITDPFYGLKYKTQEEKRARKIKARRESNE